MKKIIFGILLFFPTISHADTLSTIRTDVRLLIKDPSATRQRYSDSQINDFINEAQKQIVNSTWVLNKSTDIVLVVGTTYYTLPTDNIALLRVTLQKRNIPESSLIQLDGKFSNASWENSGGTPQNYFQDPAQTDKIGFYPWPNSSSSTGTVHIIYTCQATDMASDSDQPFNAESRWIPYHHILAHFVAYRIYLLEGELDKALVWLKEYNDDVEEMRARIGSRPNFNPSVSGGVK